MQLWIAFGPDRSPCQKGEKMRFLYCAIGAVSLLGGIGDRVCAQQASPLALVPMTVDGAFLGDGGAATDISGMACMPASNGQRTCLVINDENKNAQFVTIRNDRMTVGQPIALIGNAPNPKTSGTRPKPGCEKADDFDNLDGEGVAYSEPHFYVVGSHGCSRKKGKFRLSSFILARVRVDGQGRPAGSDGAALAAGNFAAAVETTYRVSDWLKRSKTAASFFAKDLESANGLNIEGVAVLDKTIWFGLRAPVIDGAALLVGGDVAGLFKGGNVPSKAAPRVIPVALEGRGIRDIAPLPDKRLLVLAGAAHGNEVPFKLFVVDPAKEDGNVKPIRLLAEVKQPVDGTPTIGKAEGVTVLDVTADRTQIVVLFDSLLNGAPHQGETTIPK
jgi:hypothetical protein